MRRASQPIISPAAEQHLAQYATTLQEVEDLPPTTIRNYLSDLWHFVAWCEATWHEGQEHGQTFAPLRITTPLLTRYRSYLQTVVQLKSASVNRTLISLKRYCQWAVDQGMLGRDPAKVIKLVREEAQSPRHLSDEEEEALIAAVAMRGDLRDQTIIVVLLHTGLRAQELCQLQPHQIKLGKRSSSVAIHGKHNKYRDVPRNTTARAALAHYLPTLPPHAPVVFPSTKTGTALTIRALEYIIKKYARQAHLSDAASVWLSNGRTDAPAPPRPNYGTRLAGYHDALYPRYPA